MLINLETINKKYNIQPKRIIHIGAHDGQEYDSYKNVGVEDIIWIEANPIIAERLKNRFLNNNNIKVINSLVTDSDNDFLEFNITNNEQSSSILDLGSHKNLFPEIKYTNKIKLPTKTIDTILLELDLKQKPDFMNIDVQGAELLVLKGSKKLLETVKYIYTEVNTDYVYKNCALLEEIDDFLLKYNFVRVETKMWKNHPWGDAFYIKR